MSFSALPPRRSVSGKERSVEMTQLHSRPGSRSRDDRGQATVEYFLVILAATALAFIALKWMQSGGSGLLGDLFGGVIRWVLGQF